MDLDFSKLQQANDRFNATAKKAAKAAKAAAKLKSELQRHRQECQALQSEVDEPLDFLD